MMLIIVSVLTLLLLLIYKSTRKPEKFPPGPPRLPIIGSLPYIAVRNKPDDQPSVLTGTLKGKAYETLNAIIKNTIA